MNGYNLFTEKRSRLLIEMKEQSVIYPITQQGTVKYISGVYLSIVQMDL